MEFRFAVSWSTGRKLKSARRGSKSTIACLIPLIFIRVSCLSGESYCMILDRRYSMRPTPGRLKILNAMKTDPCQDIESVWSALLQCSFEKGSQWITQTITQCSRNIYQNLKDLKVASPRIIQWEMWLATANEKQKATLCPREMLRLRPAAGEVSTCVA